MTEVLQAWEQFAAELPRESALREVVLRSWERSQAAGAPADLAAGFPPRVEGADLQRRLEDCSSLVSIAGVHLEWLSRVLSRWPHVLYLVDREGIVLHATGTSADTIRDLGLTPGHDWSERAMGTNGAGTALVVGSPVAIVGEDHYCRAFHGCTCLAAPIRDARGITIGAIDCSMSLADGRPDHLVLLAEAAFAISRELALQEVSDAGESLRALGEMSGFIAHELANPLHALSLNLCLLPHYAANSPAGRAVSRCTRLVEELQELVRDLRVLAGARPPLQDGVDVSEVVNEAITSTYLATNITLAPPEYAPDVPKINANPTLLRAAVANLLRNAQEAMPDGGRMGIRTKVQDRGTRVTVWDEGPGVPEEKQPELFRQVFTTKPGGSGMGLLLVKRIVEEAHGGRVSFSPNQPSGAQFHIDLPVTPYEQVGAGPCS